MAKKTDTKTGFSFQGWNTEHFRRTESYTKAIDRLYRAAVLDISRQAVGLKVNPDKLFSFRDYPTANRELKNIISKLTSQITATIKTGSREEWLFANVKNDAFLESIIATSQVSKETLSRLQDRNLKALDAFQKRKVKGLNLSRRVWKYTSQFKNNIELGIDVSLAEGKSAQRLSQELRQNLLEPEKLFRRVRDKHGNLQLSKAAKAYHPGQGVYRSSYKNAMRLARSEINMAYRNADNLRWEQLDFVVGYEVKLSNNHTLNGQPFYDICDILAGKYPKNFVFTGWHPQCRCFKVPILQDPDEFNKGEMDELTAALQGTEYKRFQSRKEVNDVPANFKKWVKDNGKKVDGYKSTPYFIKDNFRYGKTRNGLKI